MGNDNPLYLNSHQEIITTQNYTISTRLEGKKWFPSTKTIYPGCKIHVSEGWSLLNESRYNISFSCDKKINDNVIIGTVLLTKHFETRSLIIRNQPSKTLPIIPNYVNNTNNSKNVLTIINPLQNQSVTIEQDEKLELLFNNLQNENYSIKKEGDIEVLDYSYYYINNIKHLRILLNIIDNSCTIKIIYNGLEEYILNVIRTHVKLPKILKEDNNKITYTEYQTIIKANTGQDCILNPNQGTVINIDKPCNQLIDKLDISTPEFTFKQNPLTNEVYNKLQSYSKINQKEPWGDFKFVVSGGNEPWNSISIYINKISESQMFLEDILEAIDNKSGTISPIVHIGKLTCKYTVTNQFDIIQSFNLYIKNIHYIKLIVANKFSSLLEQHNVYNPVDQQEIIVSKMCLLSISIPNKYDTPETTPWALSTTSSGIVYLDKITNKMNYTEFIFYILDSKENTIGHIKFENKSLIKKLKIIKK